MQWEAFCRAKTEEFELWALEASSLEEKLSFSRDAADWLIAAQAVSHLADSDQSIIDIAHVGQLTYVKAASRIQAAVKRKSPFIEGAEARLRGEGLVHCPFLADTVEEREWLEGWSLQDLVEDIRVEQEREGCPDHGLEIAPVSSL